MDQSRDPSAGNDFDAIVIGAGAAGLAAAQRLHAAGLTVVILEARDRIGGRIWTLRPPGWPTVIEAGAEFIHGCPEDVWDIVRRSNLATSEISGRQWEWDGSRLQSSNFERTWSAVFQRLEEFARDDLSFAGFLDEHCADMTPRERAQATAYVEGFNAADSRRINSRWLVEADRASGQASAAGAYRLANGYDGILSGLRKENDRASPELRLKTTVSEIRWQPRQVEVQVKSLAGEPLPPVRAVHVVVTVPLGILTAAPESPGAIRFFPELAEKRFAMDSLVMGSVRKLFLRFRTPFWESAEPGAFGFLHAADEPFPTWWTTNPLQTPILVGWAGGPAATRLAGTSADIVREQALRSLSKMLRMPSSVLTDMLEDWHLVDWGSDPFARGAYSYVGVGGLDAPRRLAEPVAGTLFFAGEATHERLSGTVGGALASGRRAADELLRSLAE